MSRVWLGLSILHIIRLSYQRSDYASDPSELQAVETSDPKELQAVETTDNRQQPNPNWPQLPNVPQLNVQQTNMIPSPQMQGGFPNNLPGQQPMWPNSGAINSPGGQPMVTNPLSHVGFPGAQNPMMMGAPGAFNFPGVQNPLALGAGFPGGHPQQMNPNSHVMPGMPAHFHPVGHLPFPGTTPLMPWQAPQWTKEQLAWWYWWNYWQKFMKEEEVEEDCGESKWTLDKQTGLEISIKIYLHQQQAPFGICYLVLEQKLKWSEARDTCRREENGADLTSINSQQELNFIQALLANTKCDNCRFWMGFNDLAQEGNWVWSNGDPVTYTNWNSGEPNGGRWENFGEMVKGWGYKWNDHPAVRINPSVCSKKIHF